MFLCFILSAVLFPVTLPVMGWHAFKDIFGRNVEIVGFFIIKEEIVRTIADNLRENATYQKEDKI
jgi:hypothetical protein